MGPRPGGRRLAGGGGDQRRHVGRQGPSLRIGRSGEDSRRCCERCGLRIVDDGADTIVFQLSVWDSGLGTRRAGRRAGAAARRRARSTAAGSSSSPHRSSTRRDEQRASCHGCRCRAARRRRPGSVRFLDPTPVWGSHGVVDLDGDGTPERKRDLVHVCPSGAARFGAWLAGELAVQFAGRGPGAATDWAVGPWVTDRRFDQPARSLRPRGLTRPGQRAATTMRATRSSPASVSAPEGSRTAMRPSASQSPTTRTAGAGRRRDPRRGDPGRRLRTRPPPALHIRLYAGLARPPPGRVRRARWRVPDAAGDAANDSTTRCGSTSSSCRWRPEGSSHHAGSNVSQRTERPSSRARSSNERRPPAAGSSATTSTPG